MATEALPRASCKAQENITLYNPLSGWLFNDERARRVIEFDTIIVAMASELHCYFRLEVRRG